MFNKEEWKVIKIAAACAIICPPIAMVAYWLVYNTVAFIVNSGCL